MNEELKTCPFCGSPAEVCHSSTWDYYVICTNRQCGAKSRRFHENERGAVSSWNRRRPPEDEHVCLTCGHWDTGRESGVHFCAFHHHKADGTDFCSWWGSVC